MPLVVYGFAKDDWVIILANPIGVMLSPAVLCFKIREFDFMIAQVSQLCCQACSPRKPATKRTTTTTPMM
jgi:hypothetical protein